MGATSLIGRISSSALDPESTSDNLRRLGARSEARIDPRPFDCSAASESEPWALSACSLAAASRKALCLYAIVLVRDLPLNDIFGRILVENPKVLAWRILGYVPKS